MCLRHTIGRPPLNTSFLAENWWLLVGQASAPGPWLNGKCSGVAPVLLETGSEVVSSLLWAWPWCMSIVIGIDTWAGQACLWTCLLGAAPLCPWKSPWCWVLLGAIGVGWRLMLLALTMAMTPPWCAPWGLPLEATGVAVRLALGLGNCQCIWCLYPWWPCRACSYL